MRKIFFQISIVSLFVILGLSILTTYFLLLLLPWGFFVGIGMVDMLQKKHSIRRNFPVFGHGRYLLELIRPEIYQYFIESNSDGTPFDREKRSVVYQRAKGQLDTLPFGTQTNVYATDYEWINHSLFPKPILNEHPTIKVGGPQCQQPYFGSVFNVSAMSFGSLSKNAVLALNKGAKLGGFAHNTGEGGLSPYHLQNGGDLIWQIGTGYFSCRDKDGNFSPEEFAKRAILPNVKMIEIKLSQGAKPGHGGILPAKKLTPEIAAIRGVELGKDVLSPPAHSAFSTPEGLIQFVMQLRELSGGKPVGFKLCLGKRREFLGIIKAMIKLGVGPDFITVDGAEGGTGAAPLEFSNSVGTPLNEGLVFVHNALVGSNFRDKVKIIAAGKITSGFNIVTKLALGADICNSARGMMFALGCIQALRCNTNHCPTGVATQDPSLTVGLDVPDKAQRVAKYHHATVHSFLEVIAAAGLRHPSELRPWHILRRVDSKITKNYLELYQYYQPGILVDGKIPTEIIQQWEYADPSRF